MCIHVRSPGAPFHRGTDSKQVREFHTTDAGDQPEAQGQNECWSTKFSLPWNELNQINVSSFAFHEMHADSCWIDRLLYFVHQPQVEVKPGRFRTDIRTHRAQSQHANKRPCLSSRTRRARSSPRYHASPAIPATGDPPSHRRRCRTARTCDAASAGGASDDSWVSTKPRGCAMSARCRGSPTSGRSAGRRP